MFSLYDIFDRLSIGIQLFDHNEAWRVRNKLLIIFPNLGLKDLLFQISLVGPLDCKWNGISILVVLLGSSHFLNSFSHEEQNNRTIKEIWNRYIPLTPPTLFVLQN